MNKFYLYYSCISMLVFISGSLVFFIKYNNYQGGLWASLAAGMAGICFCLHALYFSNKLQKFWSSKGMSRLNIFSFIVCLIASAFLVWYAFTMVYWKIPLFEYKITPVFPCVFSFITGKWSLHLFSATKKYSEILLSNYLPIIQTI